MIGGGVRQALAALRQEGLLLQQPLLVLLRLQPLPLQALGLVLQPGLPRGQQRLDGLQQLLLRQLVLPGAGLLAAERTCWPKHLSKI